MMYTKEQAYAEIAKLVNTFKTSETRLDNEAEAQIENNFIRPLFKYLNWNTENEGLAIPDYEFVVQRTNRYGKRPDYILQLDGQHLLVMDAKQVKLDMHDPRLMKQVYAYAYCTQRFPPSRKIDFAILTDFQEFLVLDCTLYARKPKAVTKFCVLDLRYDEYLTKFDELWELFERENMRQAARTRGTDAPAGLWARGPSPKEVDAKRIPPDKAFLIEMDDDKTGWRVRLAKDMKKHNPEADGALITAAVQLLIDRLIFVKALSDREIEDDYLSQLAETVERDGLAESNIGWFTACRAIFTKLNEFYNGSIFEARPELEAVTVSNKVVRAIIQDLQPENSSYNFAVLPVEILGTIYERFLGRVVRTTDKQVKIEDKPEVRKAGGVYYTPQYIVNYIVQNTVGKLLQQCQTPEDVAQLKILDAACGSGSFLLGAYNALIDWHIRYYSDKARLTRHRTAVYRDYDGSVRLTAKLKRQILLNNLYGVDIDRQAVEVTRFSLSLKALEDIRQDEVYEERNLFKQTVLPDLSQNIKCGNSLIGPDYFSGQMFADPEKLLRIKPFDWANEFSAIMAVGGFDAVIGNPPWAFTKYVDWGDETKSYIQQRYLSTRSKDGQSRAKQAGKINLFAIFALKAINVLRRGGLMGIILPNNILRTTVYDVVRKQILEISTIRKIVDLKAGVFQGVTASTVIIILEADLPVASHSIEIVDNQTLGIVEDKVANKVNQADCLKNPSYVIDIFSDTSLKRIVSKADAVSTKLGEIVDVLNGIATEKNMAGILDSRKNNNSKPILFGKDIARYHFEHSGKYVNYVRAQLLRARDESIFLAPQKLIMQRIGGILVTAYDNQQYYTFNSVNNLLLKSDSQYSLKYLLGILNSKLLRVYYIARFTNKSSLTVNVSKTFLDQLPIRTVSFSDFSDKARHDKMVQLVESMLALHKHKAAAKTLADQELYQRQIEATDREIDRLVYELYGLTPEEIAVVEAA